MNTDFEFRTRNSEVECVNSRTSTSTFDIPSSTFNILFLHIRRLLLSTRLKQFYQLFRGHEIKLGESSNDKFLDILNIVFRYIPCFCIGFEIECNSKRKRYL